MRLIERRVGGLDARGNSIWSKARKRGFFWGDFFSLGQDLRPFDLLQASLLSNSDWVTHASQCLSSGISFYGGAWGGNATDDLSQK